ncbi:MAG: M20/M25/M40 family metallo-hydrolase [Spirochaetes bacterium]|nr:M20/M25/M40 family metallo-hydrolase [Spirochaetota bacterium]
MVNIKINEKRLVQTFIKLVTIDSPSYQEEKIIKYLIRFFKDNGLKVKFQKVGSSGNIVAFLKGNREGLPLFFNAHTDTVQPGTGIKPVITDKLIRSDGSTILGSDDKSAITLFLEGIRYIKQNRLKHTDIYFVLTYAEEQGLVGAKNFDFSLLKAKYGFSFDSHGKIGTAVLSAPTHYQYTVTVKGKSAHAGIEPEKGINAIVTGAKLINKIKVGKIDHETTANVGKIEGGIATNIVPEKVVFEGEVRSRNREKLKRYIKDLKSIISTFRKKYRVKIDLDLKLAYRSYDFSGTSFLVKQFRKACRAINISPVFDKSNGGSDSNIFNQNGFQCLNVSTGMAEVHSTEEYILIKDMVQGMKLFLSLITQW